MPFMPLGFAPGEWDWMNRRRGGGILGPAEGGGLFGGITEKLTSPQAQLGLQLLANSGPSRERRGFGQILGQSALGVQQAQAQQQDNDLRRQYMQAQIEQMRRPQDTGPLVPVMRDGKLVYGTRDDARGAEVPNDPQPLTDDQREYAEAQRQGYQGTFMDYMRDIGSSRATKIQLSPTAQIGGSLREKIGQNLANEVDKLHGEAQQAVTSLQNVRRAKDLVQSGIISGSLANQRLGIAKALATFTGTDPSKVANTEEFIATTARQVAENIKAFGAGTGLSDKDREFAEKMAGGQIQLTSESIARILDINERAMTGKVKLYNERRGRLARGFADVADLYDEIQIPSADATPSAGSAPAAAIEHLKRNPQLKEQFRAKYGYVPDGI